MQATICVCKRALAPKFNVHARPHLYIYCYIGWVAYDASFYCASYQNVENMIPEEQKEVQSITSNSVSVLASQVTPGLLLALFYGIYKFFDLGVDLSHYLFTYVLLFGSVVSLISIPLTVRLIHVPVRQSFFDMICALSNYIPYLFSLYLMGFLGLYPLYGLWTEFHISNFLFGVLWLAVGYRTLYQLWLLTEVLGAKSDGRIRIEN